MSSLDTPEVAKASPFHLLQSIHRQYLYPSQSGEHPVRLRQSIDCRWQAVEPGDAGAEVQSR
ncbi:hypothetical protein FOXYSP1_20398 [Fusarium oxysporum f. sp. phaseoli]